MSTPVPVRPRAGAFRRPNGGLRPAGFFRPAGRLRPTGLAAVLLCLLLVAAATGCDQIPQPGQDRPDPPTAEEMAGYYSFGGGELDVTMSGNVARVTVTLDPETYRMGGTTWARAIPYLFLFTSGTRDAFREHEGLGGVRVRTRHPGGDIMAEALLERGALSERNWIRAINQAGEARREATQRPGLMMDVIRWGEDHTDFQYNPEYIDTN
ncbi:MAG: hypothetical protein EA352_08085 [Gemmatimonadales bacterium]|nr:MAG: hypothetical protein EA352_08085 [Gemmatimonadales bacterium]